MGRKSTAQPRPVLNVPPRGIGPIVDPNENDVLCGRGGRINSHTGNVQFRDIINAKKKEYLAPTTKKLEKAHIAAAIVNDIRSLEPAGRFLKEDRSTGLWFDIGDAKAIKKTGQALREDAPDIRDEFENSSGEDEKKPATKGGEKDAKDRPKSPKQPREKTSKSPPRKTGMVSGRGPQHLASRGNVHSMTPEEYQAQIAMPPPYSFQPNPYATQVNMAQNQNGFQARNIPIQAPQHHAMYSLPNQLMAGAKNVGQRVTAVSRQAMEALSHVDGNVDDVAFGKQFHAPPSAVLNSDNTMSDISGLSNPLSSNMGLSSNAGSGLMDFRQMNMELLNSDKSSREAMLRQQLYNNSLRLSQLSASLGSSGRKQPLSNSMVSDLTGSGISALSRSLSLTDMNSLTENDTWKAIMEGDEEMAEHHENHSMMSGVTGKSSMGAMSRAGNSKAGLSAMSMASMGSIGSSGRWAMVGLRGGEVLDDGQSVGGLSEMSADILALDLAAPFQPL